MLRKDCSQTTNGDNSPNINGNGNSVFQAADVLEKSLDNVSRLVSEMAAQRELAQSNINRLFSIIEKLTLNK